MKIARNARFMVRDPLINFAIKIFHNLASQLERSPQEAQPPNAPLLVLQLKRAGAGGA